MHHRRVLDLCRRGRIPGPFPGRACPAAPAGLRVPRHRHRRRHPARAPDADHHPQGRQGRHDPARTPHRPGHRPGHRRTHGRLVFLAADGRRLDRHGAGQLSARSPAAPESTRSSPAYVAVRVHHRSWMRGCRCATSKKLPPTRTRGPLCGTTGPGAAWTGMPPISSPPTSRAPPGKQLRLAGQARQAGSP